MRRKKIGEHLEKYLGSLEDMIPIDSFIYFSEDQPVSLGRWEDFEVAVVSSAFNGMPKSKRKLFLFEYWEPASFYAELMGFTPQEMADFDNPAVREVLERGRCLKDNGIFEKTKSDLLISKKK